MPAINDWPMDRYHRQILLPQVGVAGQAKLAAASVLLVGCGALGTVTADYLARAGVGRLTIVDRDVVELTNLQRQTLFDQADADRVTPKAVAAAGRLRAVNGDVRIDPVVADLTTGNVQRLLAESQATLIIDGTDNAETRYLINDIAVKLGLPWIYGACVGVDGRVMAIEPRGPCLRCVFPEPPAPGEIETCDTAGVLGPAAGVVASLQAGAAIRRLLGDVAPPALVTIDAWTMRFRTIDLADARRVDCPCCGRRRFEYLDRAASQSAVLCGRNSVQLRTHAGADFSLERVERLLSPRFAPRRNEYLLSVAPEPGIELTLFADGRAIVHGTNDPASARAILARYLG